MPLNFEERQVEEPQDSDAWASFDEQIYNRFAKTGDYVSGGYDGTKSIPNPQQNWDYRTAELGMNGEQLPYGAESWDAFGRPYYGEGLKGYWNGVVARVTSPTQLNAEFRKSDGDEDFLEWGARALYNAGEFGKLSDTTGVDSPLTYALRVSKEIVGGGLKLLELGGIAIERGIGTAVLANQTETLDEAFQASRIFYSTLLDTTLTSQFLQEYRKGQNPELLAQELANPFAEFVGQAILDPLNFVTWMGKAAKATDLVSDAAVIADKVGDALDATRALDAADDAADYAKATETLVDAVKAEFAAIRTTKLRQEYKVGAVVATGRQSHFFTRVSDNIAGIAQALKKLNGTGADVVEHLHELARAASPVEEVANSAIPFLAKSEIGRSLLSNNGLELGVYLNKIIGEGDDAKSFISAISGLQDNLPELIKFFGEKGRKTAQELFPTISDMQEADKLRKTAIASGKVVSDELHKTADMLKEVPTAIKWISNRDSSLQKVFKPINNFFGQVYMGASPGFAARNAINNTFTMMVDQGVKSVVSTEGKLLTGFEAIATDIERWAGFVPKAAAMEIGSLAEDVTGSAAKSGWLRDLLPKNLASNNEKFTGALIVNKSGSSAFKQILPHALSPLKNALIESGIDNKAIDLIMQLGVDEFGDIGRVTERLREFSELGSISAGRDVTKIPYSLRKYLTETNQLETLTDIMLDPKLEGIDDYLAAVDKFAETHIKSADNVFRDPMGAINQDSFDAVEGVSNIRKAWETVDGLDETESAMFATWRAAHDETVNSHKSILNKLQSAAPAELRASDIVEAETKLYEQGATTLKGVYDGHWDKFFGLSDEKAGFSSWSSFAKSRLGLDIPVDVDVKEAKNLIAREIKKQQTEAWGKHFDTFYDGVQNSFDRIIGSVSEDFQKELTEGFELAKNRRVTAAKIRDAVFDPKTGHMTHSTISQELEGADRAVEIAKLFGVEKPNRKHIENIVRKYSDDAVGIGKPDNAEVIAKVGKIDNEGDIAEVVTELPRKDLPDYASNRVKEEAERLLSELYSGSGPGFSAGGQLEGGGEGFGSTNVSWYRELYKQGMGKKQVDAALNRIIQNAGKDKGVQVERVKDLIVDTFTFGDDASGIPPDLGVLKSLGAPDSVMDDALKAFNGIAGETMSMDDALRASGYVEEATAIAKKVNIDDLTDDEIIKILTNRAESKGVSADEIAKITDGIAGEKLLPPMVGNPTYARAIYESMDGFKRGIGEFKKFAVDNWQQQIPALSDDLEKVLANAPKLVGENVAFAQQKATEVAKAARDFTLLDYSQKKYGDLALAYLYPYSFWYSGTYKNWMTRTATNPNILSNYARYKSVMENIHAGMPEWWKYNINSNEVLGMDAENPLYFNLEATLWPLNGITGVDFNDPYKRVNGVTAMIDDMNKMGPSTWTPYSMATAVALAMKGEDEAAARWAGRLFPQTATFKSLLSLGNVNLPDSPLTTGNEIDPMVQMFSGGLDPYERRRVGRALADMVDNGLISEEEALDSANSQEGQIWDDAVMASTRKRAGGQISSFLFGVGFKGRNETDIRTDQFYSDYYSLMGQYDNLHPDEVRKSFDTLRNKYPFMDALLLSRKSGLDRDRSYGYAVLGRVPPGQSGDLARMVGMPDDMLSRFYEDKGKIDSWAQTDQDRFRAGIMDLGAVLAAPNAATTEEWSLVRGGIGNIREEAEFFFGEDIQDRVNLYYNLPMETQTQRDQREEWLEQNHAVRSYLDWYSQKVNNDPLIREYYGSVSSVESYIRRQMNDAITAEVGQGIYDTLDEYYAIRAFEPGSAKAYRNAHPEISRYYDIKDEWRRTENEAVARVGGMFRSQPAVEFREDVPDSFGAESLLEGLQQPPKVDWSTVLPPEAIRVVQSYWTEGEEIPYYVEKFLNSTAYEYGADGAETIIRDIGATMQ